MLEVVINKAESYLEESEAHISRGPLCLGLDRSHLFASAEVPVDPKVPRQIEMIW